jgi:acetyltransferase-like isoleucine patch superfamily enzyme
MCKFNFFKRIIIKLSLKKSSKNEMESVYLRKMYSKLFNIDVGLYSYGCFNFPNIPSNTEIGRYCSFGPGIRIFNANHPSEYIFLHAYMYNTTLGMVKKEPFKRTKLKIGNDVWIGANAIILPSVNYIGDGAIIGAGAIVTKNVPDFAIVVGNPAKIIKYRFSEKTRELINKNSLYKIDKKYFMENIKKFYSETTFIEFIEKK